MHFAHYLGRACIYGVERKGKEIEIRDGLNQCDTHITWDAHVFMEKRGREGKESLPIRFAHYLGRACIYLEERNGKGKEIRGGRNQCASRITWDAPAFTERI